MERVQIGIIGGSGLYDMAEVTDRSEVTLQTPFGEPSGPYVLGTLRGKRVAFLARHGAGHRFSPSELNFRANIFGMKMLGVEYILSASAVGSLKEEYAPLHIVIPDQFIDRTQGPHQHVLRPRPRRARRLRASVLQGPQRHCIRQRHARRRDDSQGRHLRLHGGTAVLDARRVAALSLVGRRHHRHDQPAGSEARPRGRDLLHDDRAGHRLRLLASRPRLGDGGHDHRQPDAEREDRAADHRRRRRCAAVRALVRVRVGAEVRPDHPA